MSNKLTTAWSRWLVTALLVMLPAVAVAAQEIEDDAGPFVAVWSWIEDCLAAWTEPDPERGVSADPDPDDPPQEVGPEPEPLG